MTRTSGARSATDFKTAQVTIAQRPTHKIKIGSLSLVARAPKIDVWRETMRMISKVDLARDLNEREELSGEEQAQLDALVTELADLDVLEEAIITGIEIIDEAGEIIAIKGGFLRRCFPKDDWLKIFREWKDDESDLDTDNLFHYARVLLETFGPWFSAREHSLGIPVSPKVKPIKAGK